MHLNVCVPVKAREGVPRGRLAVWEAEAEAACGRKGAHWVVQKYIERPLLVGGRKFDIRAYALVAPCGRVLMHRSSYARTSSSAFGLADLADRRALRLLAWAPPAAAHIWHHNAWH